MKDIIREIAKRNGVSTQEVKREMRIAIREGMKNRNANATAKEFWDSISPNGEEPPVEVFIMACANIVPIK